MNAFSKLESMQEMAARLHGTGGGDQANAVIEAIGLIRAAPGILDANNRTTALWHLATALSGVRNAAQTIEDASLLIIEDHNPKIGAGRVCK